MSIGSNILADGEQRVFLMRHGERLDEADKRAWAAIATQDTYHDPPLTEKGKHQAAVAGKALKLHLGTRDIAINKTKLFVSTSLRTLGTAAHAGKALGSREMILTPGAFQCAAAARRAGLSSLRMSAKHEKPFIEMTEEFPVSDKVHGGLGDTYSSAIDSILNSLKPCKTVPIIVTHREGIRLTLKKARATSKLPYCVCAEFIHSPDKSWRLVHVIIPPTLPKGILKAPFTTPKERTGTKDSKPTCVPPPKV
eukprot:TRINITY_DN13440_c0_g1_i1.p1 TRINITY_DN13440_c0_g1~~TRINITY_DN13440_c0_g1_i1.p1  ORF type:complete len:252 (+),score=35.92 TRINITY_DN13440_c0_g1_i1:43-798(+)